MSILYKRGDKMDINNILNQLKEILPAENFKAQPETAREELLQLEKKYQMNTSDFLVRKISMEIVPEEVQEQWINTLETFIQFGGSLKDLNHLLTDGFSSAYAPFINQQTPNGDPTKEYLSQKSKESGWLPCFFISINYFINF